MNCEKSDGNCAINVSCQIMGRNGLGKSSKGCQTLMIHLDRNRCNHSGQPIEPNQDWFREATAEQKVADAAAGKNYEFKAAVYGHDAVRVALDKLFYGKCGYCEYRIVRFDADIDHYRPKGRVAEATGHPGYYWLAYNWTNLIPTCTFCNRRRRERAEYPGVQRSPAAGKADSFPLREEDKRAWSPSDELSAEEPLLLNPTIDFPEDHLSFYPDGEAYSKTHRGEETIRILNLNAYRIRKDRQRTIDHVAKLLENDTNKPNVAINDLIADSAEYAGAAREVVRNPTAFGLQP